MKTIEQAEQGDVVIVTDNVHVYFLCTGLITSITRSEETNEIINVCFQVRRPDTWVVTKAYAGKDQVKVLD